MTPWNVDIDFAIQQFQVFGLAQAARHVDVLRSIEVVIEGILITPAGELCQVLGA